MKAYPYLHKHPTSGETTISEGMDLRDYFAGQALPAVLHLMFKIKPSEEVLSSAVTNCYKFADAMMQARKQGGSQ